MRRARSILIGAAAILLAITSVALVAATPYWLFSVAIGSMLNEDMSERTSEFWAATPYLVVMALWLLLWVTARLTQPSTPSDHASESSRAAEL
jgi:hypothetical protein